MRPHLRHLRGDVLRHADGRRDAGGLRGQRRLISGLGIVGKVSQDRARSFAEQIQCGAQHAMLQRGVVRPPERVAEGKRHEQRARRLHLLGVLAHQADRARGDAVGFERTGEHTNGVRAERSGRGHDGDVHALVAKAPGGLRTRLSFEADEVTLRAHERVISRSQPAELRASDELADTVDRKRDVDVAHDRQRGRTRCSCGSG